MQTRHSGGKPVPHLRNVEGVGFVLLDYIIFKSSDSLTVRYGLSLTPDMTITS